MQSRFHLLDFVFILTDPFSMTLLSIITALVPCSQIISQKWPQVWVKGPWGSKNTH